MLYCIGTYTTVLLKMNAIQSFKIHLFIRPDILEPSVVGNFRAGVLDDDPDVLNADNECKLLFKWRSALLSEPGEGTQTGFILFP